jgi:low density lipoprotein receptor-related protein 5/6
MARAVIVTFAVLAAIVAICNVGAVPKHFIVVAEMRRLRGLELNQSARFTTDIFDPVESSKAIAVDFDARTGNIYWTDYIKKAIMRIRFNTTEKAVVFPGLETPDGMAIDWIGNHIYYTDSTLSLVGMLSMDGYYSLPLVQSQLDEPRAISLDPSHG